MKTKIATIKKSEDFKQLVADGEKLITVELHQDDSYKNQAVFKLETKKAYYYTVIDLKVESTYIPNAEIATIRIEK